MNRRSLFKAFAGASAVAAVPVAAVAEPVKPGRLKLDPPGDFYTDPSGGRWKIVFTNWKSMPQNPTIVAQLLAYPVDSQGNADEYRPNLVATSGGQCYSFKRGDDFDLSHIAGIEYLHLGDPEHKLEGRKMMMTFILHTLIKSKVAKVDWYTPRQIATEDYSGKLTTNEWLPVNFLNLCDSGAYRVEPYSVLIG